MLPIKKNQIIVLLWSEILSCAPMEHYSKILGGGGGCNSGCWRKKREALSKLLDKYRLWKYTHIIHNISFILHLSMQSLYNIYRMYVIHCKN